MGLKHKICISVDEETRVRVLAIVREGHFRNTSHAFEYAAKRFLENALN